MKNSKEILTNLATVQSAAEELYNQHIELCGFNHDGVHVLDSMFVKLFEDKREIVGRKDLNSKENPFMYFTHIFGTKFFCISDNPDLFPTYPVEQLAKDLLTTWSNLEDQNRYRVIYTNGSYALANELNTDKNETVIYSHKQFESDESVTLEQAILDYMEGVHNNAK